MTSSLSSALPHRPGLAPACFPVSRSWIKEVVTMRVFFVAVLAVALFAAAWTCFPAHAFAQGQIPDPVPATTQAALPILNFLGNDEVCNSWVEVQNVGSTFTRVAMMVWGEPGFCAPQCAGPLKVECTGLLKPGATWNFLGAQVPTGAKSGILFSLSASSLSDYGLDEAFGFDDIIADLLCETLFFGIVGDCDDYRRFKLAYDQGGTFAGMPMDLALGQPIAAEVLRRCSGPDQPDLVSSKYDAIPGTRIGRFDPVYGGFAFYAPLVYADAAGFESVLYIQNVGLDCSSAEIWFQQQDNCLRPLICEVFTLAAGETFQFSASDCVGPGWMGSAWIRTSQPIAMAVDHVASGLLMTYSGTPSQLRYSFNGQPYYTPGSIVAYGPLVYSEYQGWDTGVQVQNLSATTAAKVKVYFLDRSGDIVTTLVDWICPRGSQTFYLPAITTLPGNWVGTVRVESQEWFTPGGPFVNPTPITAVAQLIKYADIQHTGAQEAIAYNLLPEYDAFDWQTGALDGGTSSGVGLIAVPSLLKDLDGTGVTTEIAIANFVPKPGFTDFAIYIYDMNGLIDYVCDKLNEKQVDYIDLQTWGYINPGFKGSAIISATFWEHDVFSPTGQFVRNLLGLGAVTIERSTTRLGENVPGDQAAGSLAIPITSPFHFQGLHMPSCPGVTGEPRTLECPETLVFNSGDVGAPIIDGNTTEHTIASDHVPAGCVVKDVNLFLALTHDRNSDVTADLKFTNNLETRTGRLFSGICDVTANIVTTLDDDVLAPIGSSCPPLGGRYSTSPAGGLDTFDGALANGSWTLQITDNTFNGATGELLNWTLELHTEAQ
jgi:hypothetical protein